MVFIVGKPFLIQLTEDRLNLLASVILLCGLPLTIMLVAWIAARSGWMIALGGVAALAVAAAWAIAASHPVPGLIIGKSETLQTAPRGLDPGVTRRLVLIVVEDPAFESNPQREHPAQRARNNLQMTGLMRSPNELQCEVDERLFDTVREGDHIPLHIVKWGPLSFAWPATGPWWNEVAARLERLLPSGWSVDQTVTAEAQIVSVRTVRDADVWMWGSTSANRVAHFPLAQPYEEVQLRFVAPGGAQILALDRIDAGSAGTLALGSGVAVSYPSDRPRTARLLNGKRSYAWRNARSYWTNCSRLRKRRGAGSDGVWIRCQQSLRIVSRDPRTPLAEVSYRACLGCDSGRTSASGPKWCS
jgi:hypothetical protein